MDGKIIQEPAQVQSGVTPTNYCTNTATFGSIIGGQGTAELYCPFYPRFIVLRVGNILWIGSEGRMFTIGTDSSNNYTYVDNYLRVSGIYGYDSSTQYTLTAFG